MSEWITQSSINEETHIPVGYEKSNGEKINPNQRLKVELTDLGRKVLENEEIS